MQCVAQGKMQEKELLLLLLVGVNSGARCCFPTVEAADIRIPNQNF
jgi:hypothetical protein